MAKQRNNYANNREEILAKQRDNYAKNREEILAKCKDNYVNNREAILAKQKKKIECQCGGRYSYSGKSNHLKTKKHRLHAWHAQWDEFNHL